MSARAAFQTVAVPTPSMSGTLGGSLLQRKCACGGAAGLTGDCAGCSKRKRLVLQTKLKINDPGDRYEQEADRVADQVLRAATTSALSQAPPSIQRFSGESTGQTLTAPPSIDEVLAHPGRPLDPGLQRDMELRFGHDFSRVRVHVDAAADRSAHDVNADAYTVGHHVVFGRGVFAPATHEGRRLLAHELTHVVQQSGANRIHAGEITSSIRPTPHPYVARKGGGPVVRTQPRTTQTTPYRQPRVHWGPTVNPYTRGRPPYPRLPKGGALTAKSLENFHTSYPKIAIATFAPLGKIALRNVSWGGRASDFNKEGTTTVEAADPERFNFAILHPPTSVYQGELGPASFDVSYAYTWDGYVIPVVSDLDAALVVALDAETGRVFSTFGREIESTMKWDFLDDFVGTYWVPIENIQIKEALPGGGVVLSPAGVIKKQERARAKAEQEFLDQIAQMPRPEPFRRVQEFRDAQLKPPPEVLRFAFDRREVTVSALIAWLDRTHPDGFSDQHLLAALNSSSEFIFSGSTDVRAKVAAALVTQLRQKTEASEDAKATSTAPVKRKQRRRKRKCTRTAGASCPTWHPRLTSRNEYWDQAFNFRRTQRLLMPSHFSQNIAVLLLDGEPPIIRANEMQFHSEQQILWTLANRDLGSDCPIIGLFSERKPCQEICQRQILPHLCRMNSGVPFDVYFATDYYNSSEGIRSHNNRHALIASYSQAGYFEGF